MVDVSWLSGEAKTLHDTFQSLFFPLITSFILFGVVTEYFKWPVGGVPSFGVLIGRALVAAVLLVAYPDITNLLADVADGLAASVGDFGKIDEVLSKMGDKLETLSASWVSVKETVAMAATFLSFLLLYFSKFIAEGLFMFVWTLLYVFSPVLIAMYTVPATAGATKALFRTLFEVSAWKVVWAVLTALLWSSVLSMLDAPNGEINFVSLICMNLALAGSLLLTPRVVTSLTTTGLSGFASSFGGIAVGGTFVSPGWAAQKAKQMGTKTVFVGQRIGESTKRVFQSVREKTFIKNSNVKQKSVGKDSK